MQVNHKEGGGKRCKRWLTRISKLLNPLLVAVPRDMTFGPESVMLI